MDKKEAFKGFVRENPSLMRFIKNGEMTWQKFFEIYDMYGADNRVWNDYLKETVTNATATAAATSTALAAIPGDATTPIANQIMELCSYLLIVVCALVLEKSHE